MATFVPFPAMHCAQALGPLRQDIKANCCPLAGHQQTHNLYAAGELICPNTAVDLNRAKSTLCDHARDWLNFAVRTWGCSFDQLDYQTLERAGFTLEMPKLPSRPKKSAPDLASSKPNMQTTAWHLKLAGKPLAKRVNLRR